MLYISRFTGQSQYGLVDTVTGVERLVTYPELVNLHKSGVVIAGVTGRHAAGDEEERTILLKIVPFQPQDTLSILQIKTNVLRRIEVLVHGDEITSIIWRGDEIDEPVDIVLSDFGHTLGSWSIMHNTYRGPTKCRLIFDETVKLAPYALMPHSFLDNIGAVFDVRLIESFWGSVSVYSALRSHLDVEAVMGYVVDHEERKARIKEFL